jgi:starch synthase
MLKANIQYVQIGTGTPAFESAFAGLGRRFPARAATRVGFDQALSHRIEAACDFFLMPSRFEPCGLNQMYSQRYGTIPIVRATGGLDDTVVDIRENPDKADGVKFHEYSAEALIKAMRKALALYAEPTLLDHYRRNAMAANFSWHRAVGRYLAAYQETIAS